jgi:glucan biosynthesis protein C
MNANGSSEPSEAPPRHHSLDSLRAAMMLLGIVIHATLPYLPGDPEAEMPFRDEAAASGLYLLVIHFIHSFRMSVFFVMAGFFAALLTERRGPRGLLINRFRRIVIPFAVGWVVLFPLLAAIGTYFRAGRGLIGLRGVLNDLVTGRLYADPNPIHLWFLYYLAFFYPLGLGVAALLRRAGPSFRGHLHRAYRRALQSPIRPALFAIPTALTLWPMATGGFDTPSSFWPSTTILVAYGVFFGFGWLLHAHADLLPSFSRHAWKQIGLALLLWPLNVFAIAIVFITGTPVRDPASHLLAVVSGALIAWLTVFGLTGLFVRYLNRSIPWLRYVTDASYWCYLMHLPLLFVLAALVAPLRVPSPIKVLLLIVMATLLLLLAYHYGVRATILGQWLNGRRYPRESAWARDGRDLQSGQAHQGRSAPGDKPIPVRGLARSTWNRWIA